MTDWWCDVQTALVSASSDDLNCLNQQMTPIRGFTLQVWGVAELATAGEILAVKPKSDYRQ